MRVGPGGITPPNSNPQTTLAQVLKTYPDFPNVLQSMGISIDSIVSVNVEVFAAALASQDTRRRIKKKLQDVEASKQKHAPSAELLSLLGITDSLDNLEFKFSRGGLYLLKSGIATVEDE
ncbi:MAG: hypothetical protein VW378_06765 [bacterium]